MIIIKNNRKEVEKNSRNYHPLRKNDDKRDGDKCDNEESPDEQ